MKTIFLIACFLLGVNLTHAQKNSALSPEKRAEIRTEKLTKELNLSADQQEKIKSIFLRAAQKNQEIRKNEAMTPTQRDELIQKNNHTVKDKIRTVMTEEQRQLFDAQEAEREKAKAKKKNKAEVEEEL